MKLYIGEEWSFICFVRTGSMRGLENLSQDPYTGRIFMLVLHKTRNKIKLASANIQPWREDETANDSFCIYNGTVTYPMDLTLE